MSNQLAEKMNAQHTDATMAGDNSNMKKALIFVVAMLALLVLGNGVYSYLNNTPDTKRVPVSTFYDGNDGYSISIKTGNTSTCTWNAADRNSGMPHRETTVVWTIADQHTVYANDYYDWIVTCVDDLGNHYTGIFPKN